MDNPEVSIRPVAPAERPVLDRLWLMFRHDLSQFRGVLPNPDGTFRSDRLDAAFTDPGWAAYLIWSRDRPVGLALVRGLDAPVRVLNAFFVVRAVRCTGVAHLAVREVLHDHPGPLAVAFQSDNETAVRFWRRVATATAGQDWTEERRAVPDRPDLAPDVWVSFSTGSGGDPAGEAGESSRSTSRGRSHPQASARAGNRVSGPGQHDDLVTQWLTREQLHGTVSPGRRRTWLPGRFVACCGLPVSFDFHAAYDGLNPRDDDYRFYAGLARDRDVRRVVDLGCGTGVLAVMLARAGLEVVAVDPDREMLRVARGRSGTELVSWRDGGAESVPTGWADLVTMSGHTAQVFTTDDAWRTALLHIHRGLASQGLVAFETRNPDARAWEAWTRRQTLRVVASAEGPVEFWHDTVHVELPLVTYETTTADVQTGHTDTGSETLAFRDEAAVRATLSDTGFVVEEILGNWDGRPLTSTSPELIVIARAA